MKIYFEGTADGDVIKIGKTTRSTSRRRAERTDHFYARRAGAREYLLAAVQSDANAETHLKKHFDHLLIAGETEYFHAKPELVEYVYWLRDQYFTWLSDEDGPDDHVGYEAFAPRPDRRRALPEPDGASLMNDWDCREPMPLTEDLRGTAWSAMSVMKPVYNDYYTPLWLIELAREGMGGIDLDPASHWSAARAQRIKTYYSRQHDAHTRPWFGRIWLNAPYGDNKPWIDDIVRHWDASAIEQLCWLAPAWAFNTRQARPVMDRCSLAILLTGSTQMFWGWGKKTDKREENYCSPDEATLGPNHPHLIVYLGDRVKEMARVFTDADRGLAFNPKIEA